MADVIEVLQQEHANLAKLLRVLERQLAVFREGGDPDYDIMSGVVEYCLDFPEQIHHPKEDLIYRKLAARDPGAIDAIGDLEAEHENLTQLTQHLANALTQILNELEVPRDQVDQVAHRFIDTYWRHLTMEERDFFPAALKALTAEDWAEINAQVGNREDPLFGTETEHRFESLRQNILALDEIT